MAAAGLGLAFGMRPDSIWKGLSSIQDSAWGRNQILKLQNGARILFDAYNANPDSMAAMLMNLYDIETPGRKMAILGDMRELGTFSDRAHFELGEKAAAIPLAAIWYVGEFSEPFWRGFKSASGSADRIFTSGSVE
jgi:UDP-N-acetylmuramoyl-tripeptide--D-alanyl-D-alanine ligase